MAKAKQGNLTVEEKLEQALVKDRDKPYDVPGNWVWTKLNAICDFERGITFPASAKNDPTSNNLIACLRTANVQEQLDISDLIYVDRSYMKNNSTKFVRANDIIMSSANSRELVGKVSFVEYIDEKMTFGGFVLAIRTRQVYSKYLFYYLRLEFLSGNFMGESTQTTNIANVNTTKLGRYNFPLPPLLEQHRIVATIESLFSKLDRAKELAQSALDTFGNRKAAILHKAFTGELTKKWREENIIDSNTILSDIYEYYSKKGNKDKKFISEGQRTSVVLNEISNSIWYKSVIGAIGVVTNGSTPSRKINSFWKGTIPWISSGEVKNNLIRETNELITQEGYDNSSVKMLPIGTVLIAMIGEGKTRGQSAVLEITATTNQNVAAIIIEHGFICSKFLWYWLQKEYQKNREKGNGTGPQALNCQRVRELEFIIPPLLEQKEIVRILDNLLQNEQRAKTLCDVIEKIDLMKKALLARAFRGELGTNDEAEESALGLLREIL